jgi:hypothetical protein
MPAPCGIVALGFARPVARAPGTATRSLPGSITCPTAIRHFSCGRAQLIEGLHDRSGSVMPAAISVAARP